jgi:CRP-like cAMP-binding protein
MESRSKSRIAPKKSTPTEDFDARILFEVVGSERPVVHYERSQTIFRQGDACDGVFFLQSGSVKLWVLSRTGREAVVGMLSPGDFFGEGCLAGQLLRMGSATATVVSAIRFVPKEQMTEMLHKQPVLSDRFISYLLARNIRIEEDLIDQLFNSSEKRLARALLLLARYGVEDKQVSIVPIISQATLAEMVGTTRSRVNFFLNKFKRLGFIEYTGELPIKVHRSLLSVVLHD